MTDLSSHLTAALQGRYRVARWSADGRATVYVAPGEEIMAVSVGDGPGSMLSTPEVFLISERFYARAVSGGER